MTEIQSLQTRVAELQASVAVNRAVGAAHPITATSVSDVFAGYAKQGAHADSAKARGEFYKQNIAPIIARLKGSDFDGELAHAVNVLASNVEVKAANSLGTLVGNLVAQRSLDLLKVKFPVLSLILTDFGNASAKLDQEIYTRTKGAASVSTYAGSFTAGASTTVDVPVTIGAHIYAQAAFNANELGGTNRNLFAEEADGLAYGLGKHIVDDLYSLIDTSAFADSAQKTTVATASVTRATLLTMGRAMSVRGVEKAGRVLLANADVYNILAQDAAVVALGQYQRPEIITENELGRIAGFQVVEAVSLGGNACNLTAVGLHPQAPVSRPG